MTKSNRILSSTLVLLALLLVSTPLEAQRGGGRGGRGGPGAAAQLPQMLTVAIEHHEDIGLDAETLEGLQALKVEVDEAYEPFEARMEAARGGGRGGGMRELFGEIAEAMSPFAERFNGLVSEDQRTELQQYMPRRGRRGGGL